MHAEQLNKFRNKEWRIMIKHTHININNINYKIKIYIHECRSYIVIKHIGLSLVSINISSTFIIT